MRRRSVADFCVGTACYLSLFAFFSPSHIKFCSASRRRRTCSVLRAPCSVQFHRRKFKLRRVFFFFFKLYTVYCVGDRVAYSLDFQCVLAHWELLLYSSPSNILARHIFLAGCVALSVPLHNSWFVCRDSRSFKRNRRSLPRFAIPYSPPSKFTSIVRLNFLLGRSE